MALSFTPKWLPGAIFCGKWQLLSLWQFRRVTAAAAALDSVAAKKKKWEAEAVEVNDVATCFLLAVFPRFPVPSWMLMMMADHGQGTRAAPAAAVPPPRAPPDSPTKKKLLQLHANKYVYVYVVASVCASVCRPLRRGLRKMAFLALIVLFLLLLGRRFADGIRKLRKTHIWRIDADRWPWRCRVVMPHAAHQLTSKSMPGTMSPQFLSQESYSKKPNPTEAASPFSSPAASWPAYFVFVRCVAPSDSSSSPCTERKHLLV